MNRANNSGGPAAPADKGRNKQYCIGSAVRRESPGVQPSADGCLSQKENQGWADTSAQRKGLWLKLGHLPQHREVLAEVHGAGPDPTSGSTKEQLAEVRGEECCSSSFISCCARTSHICYPMLPNPSLPSQRRATEATLEALKQQITEKTSTLLGES